MAVYDVHCTSYNVRRRVYYGQCDSSQSYKDYNGVSRTLCIRNVLEWYSEWFFTSGVGSGI